MVCCRPFHDLQSPQVEVFLTDNRGWGVKAAETIMKGTFVVEYAGGLCSNRFAHELLTGQHLGLPHICMCLHMLYAYVMPAKSLPTPVPAALGLLTT